MDACSRCWQQSLVHQCSGRVPHLVAVPCSRHVPHFSRRSGLAWVHRQYCTIEVAQHGRDSCRGHCRTHRVTLPLSCWRTAVTGREMTRWLAARKSDGIELQCMRIRYTAHSGWRLTQCSVADDRMTGLPGDCTPYASYLLIT